MRKVQVVHWMQLIRLLMFSEETPNLENLFKDHLAAMEAKNTDDALHNHARVTELVQKLWNVHHEGQPLPVRNAGADEDEDLIMSQVR